jgi:uncharacterized protein (TIGR00106 family)
MAIAEVSIVPLGTKTPSVSRYLARAFSALRHEKGLKYEITPMGTVIEGELGDILRVVQNMHQATFGEGVARVLTTIKIDDRRDKGLTMKGKVASLLRELER